MTMKQMKDPDIPLSEDSLSHVTLLRASFDVYGFDYFRGTLSMTLHSCNSAEDVTRTLTSGMIVGGQVLSKAAKVLLLDGRHHLEAM